jgi:hypothetical protein
MRRGGDALHRTGAFIEVLRERLATDSHPPGC